MTTSDIKMNFSGCCDMAEVESFACDFHFDPEPSGCMPPGPVTYGAAVKWLRGTIREGAGIARAAWCFNGKDGDAGWSVHLIDGEAYLLNAVNMRPELYEPTDEDRAAADWCEVCLITGR